MNPLTENRASEVSFQLHLEDCSDEREEDEDEDAGGPTAAFVAGHCAVFQDTWTNDAADDSRSASPEMNERRPLRVEFVGMTEIGVDNTEHMESDLKRFHRKGGHSSRYIQPRMSLLGKPLNYRAHKRDARYRRSQAKVYNFLERPKDWRAISYHLLVWVQA